MMRQGSQDLSLINQELHWAFGYIGTPWSNGAQGPEAYDCWSFFRFVQKKHFERVVPIVIVDADNFRAVARAMSDEDKRVDWLAVEKPVEGCAVLMAHSKYPSHVGVYLDVDGGGVLHCVRGEGVVFSSLSSLKNSGWGRVEYYKHVSDT